MKNLLLTVALYATISVGAVCYASDVPVGNALKNIPTIKTGMAYSVCDQKWNYLSTFNVATWKGFTLEAGWSGSAENTADKVVGVISYDIFKADKYITWPIAKYVDLRLGIYGGVGRVQLGDAPTRRGGNETDYGISLTALSYKW